MSMYQGGFLTVNTYDFNQRKRKYACRDLEVFEVIQNLEKSVMQGRIFDYEVFGYSAYTSEFEGVKYGEKVFLRELQRVKPEEKKVEGKYADKVRELLRGVQAKLS